MPRYIRYLENGVYKYSSIKDVGDIARLKTSEKQDLVSAINSLIDGGILESVQPVIDRIDEIVDSIDGQSDTIANQEELIEALEKADQEAILREAEMKVLQEKRLVELKAQIEADAKIKSAELKELSDKAMEEALKKADVTYVDGKLSSKIDSSVYTKKYTELEKKLTEKISLDKYQQEYASIVENLEQKADAIEVQGIIDSVNQDITAQTVEVDNARNNIANLDTKVDTVKSEIDNTIREVISNATELDAKVVNSKAELDKKIADNIASVNASTAKAQELLSVKIDNSALAINTRIDNDIKNVNAEIVKSQALLSAEIDTDIAKSKLELNTKINTDIANVNKAVTSVQGTITDTNDNLSKTKSDLLDTIKELDSVKNNIVYKIEIFSTNGGVFKNGQFDTTLQARVYHGSNEVTDTLNASRFKWTRVSKDKTGDTAWNMSNAGGTKTIVITSSDVYARATFNCELLEV